MASKREIKKAIYYACGEMASECIYAADAFGKDEDSQKWGQVIVKIASLQKEALARTAVRFDKTLSNFKSKQEYNKARRTFYKQEEKKLSEYLHSGAEQIVEAINALLPKKGENDAAEDSK